MREVLSILAGALFTVAVAIALGSLAIRALGLRFHRVEATLFQFVAGAGLLSFVVTLLAVVHQARKGVFLGLGLAAIAAALWRGRVRPISRRSLPGISLNWLVPFYVMLGALSIYYFFNALAPEISPDGSGYHLGNVARMWRNHGFDWTFRSMYAYLSQGAEMLFLVAFSIGRHSAAALVHFSFLLSLPLLMLCYGRRFGLAKASLFAALLIFGSPVVAKDGISAYNDLAVVTLIYAVFYLLQVWDQEGDSNLLILIGFFAGFAYAVKYTAVLTLPFAIGWVWWRKGLRSASAVRLILPAAILIAPWVIRNWVWVGNPVAPFANAWFPNPYFHPGMERSYVESLKHYEGIKHWWQIPLELTLRGGLVSGTFNPAFLMLPLSLLALRSTQGRRLLFAAALFAVPAWYNTGARFLMPSAPFAATALGLGLAGIPLALPVTILFTALLAWPTAVSAYCDPWNWRISRFPKQEALRQEGVESYLLKNLPDYGLKRAIEMYVPPGERVFSFAGRPDAYIDRDIVVSYESSLGNLVHEILWTPQAHIPAFQQRFRFAPLDVRAIRVVNNTATNPWTVAEMRVFLQEKEVPREAAWKVNAYPNGWEAPLAFDNSYATRWSTWQMVSTRAYVELDFPGTQRLDSVAIECDPAWDARLQVDAQLPDGRWVAITDTVDTTKLEQPSGIRRAAARDVKLLGFRYLLVNEGDLVYEDFRKNLGFWGITQLTQLNGTHFYRID